MRFLQKIVVMCGAVAAAKCGIAISCNDSVLRRARDTIADYARVTLQKTKLQDIHIGDNVLQRLHFEGVDLTNELLDLYIEDGRLKFNLANFGTRLLGHSWKKLLFGEENIDFEYGINKGGLLNLHLDFLIGETNIDGRVLPFPQVTGGHIDVIHQYWHLSWNTADVGANIGMWAIKNFQAPIINQVKNYLNDNMPSMMNQAISDAMTQSRDQGGNGILQSLADILPDNNIQIPHNTHLSYEMVHPHAHINRKNLLGYFKGDILNMPEDKKITDERYLGVGDLQLDEDGDTPFQYQMSAKVLNEMFSVLLGDYQISMDAPYSLFEQNNFPIKWNSDNLETAVPGLCDAVGYDKKLSAKFLNSGAPKFIFKDKEITIVFDMEVQLYDEHYENKYLSFFFRDVQIQFGAKVEGTSLTTDWRNIQMERTDVVSDLAAISKTDKEVAGKLCTKFFNTALYFILPWVNEEQPVNVNNFTIPDEIPDLVRIKNLQVEPRENYIHMTMDPDIIMKF